jgi:NAD(P)-dependent dehydrogenase (short-subunit alcohol dehydrogenase family)
MKELFHINVIGNVHLFNLFLPLIQKGQTKKVIVIASAYADMDWTIKYDLTPGSLYGSSKAAMNLITAKYSAQYKKEGVLFLSISPGMVEVGLYDDGIVHPHSYQALDHL